MVVFLCIKQLLFPSLKCLPKWRQQLVKNGGIFLSKNSKFCIVRTMRFPSNFTSMWSKYFSSNVWEILDFQCQHQQWLYKIPDRKINFCSNLLLKLFPATVANADIGSLKSLHTFLKMLYHILMKFEPNCNIPNYTKVLSFLIKNRFFKTIFDKAMTPLWKTFLQLKQLFNAKLLIFRLPSFSGPKSTVVRHCNQVKKCSRHGRPD